MIDVVRYKNIATIGLLGAVGVVLGVMENYFPLPVPGLRIGLANISVMVALYLHGFRSAFMVTLIKILLVPLLSGNIIFRLTIAIPAGLASLLGMIIVIKFLKDSVTPISVGVVSSFFHMVVQLLVINQFYIKGVLYSQVAGWFFIVSVVAGCLTGAITLIVYKRLKVISIF